MCPWHERLLKPRSRPSAAFGILRQNEPMVVVTTVVSLVLYTLAEAPERVVSASLGVTAP